MSVSIARFVRIVQFHGRLEFSIRLDSLTRFQQYGGLVSQMCFPKIFSAVWRRNYTLDPQKWGRRKKVYGPPWSPWRVLWNSDFTRRHGRKRCFCANGIIINRLNLETFWYRWIGNVYAFNLLFLALGGDTRECWIWKYGKMWISSILRVLRCIDQGEMRRERVNISSLSHKRRAGPDLDSIRTSTG